MRWNHIEKEGLKEMQRILAWLFPALIIFAGAIELQARNTVPKKGDSFPPIRLPVPKDPVDRGYLGLSGEGPFEIGKINTRILVVEVYSMYCTVCQKIAPELNEMFHLVEGDPQLRGRIKIIGIGAGDSPYEVEVYRKTHKTPFPLFPDRDFTIHKAIGEVRAPYFFAVRIREDGTPEVIYSEAGSFGDTRSFLDALLEASGLK